MSRRRLGTNEASRARMALCEGRVESFTCTQTAGKTRQLVLRETAIVHMDYKNYVQLIHGLTQAESNHFCARSTSDSRQASQTQPRRSLKVIEEIWGLKTPRKRTCEHTRRLDSAAYILTDQNPSLYLDRAALHLNLHPYRSFWLTYRNHTTRRPKSGVYAEVVCRRWGERSTADERQSHLDTSTTPVCPFYSQYLHSLVDVRV